MNNQLLEQISKFFQIFIFSKNGPKNVENCSALQCKAATPGQDTLIIMLLNDIPEGTRRPISIRDR